MPRADHILSFADSLAGGGVERALLRLARGWVDAGRRVTLVLGNQHGSFGGEFDPCIEHLSGPLPRIIRDRRPDILFCPGSHYTSRALGARLRLGRACPPIVAKLSNAVERGDHGPVMRALHRRWLRLHPAFLDVIVAMTPASADAFLHVSGIGADRLAIIPNPPLARILGSDSRVDPDLILGVGRLVPQKRWDRLLDALPRLGNAAARLVILGEGAERGALEARARRLGIADRVALPGHVADPLAHMASAALVALPSDFEGVPGVLREALSVGTPVVTTESSPAIAEIVTSPMLGTIVPREDPIALAAALDHWLAPGARRPLPVSPPGTDSAERYLALFDALVSRRA